MTPVLTLINVIKIAQIEMERLSVLIKLLRLKWKKKDFIMNEPLWTSKEVYYGTM